VCAFGRYLQGPWKRLRVYERARGSLNWSKVPVVVKPKCGLYYSTWLSRLYLLKINIGFQLTDTRAVSRGVYII